MKFIRTIAAFAVAGVIGTLGVNASAAPAATAAPGQASGSGAVESSYLVQRVTVVLSPSSPSAASTASASPNAGSYIVCAVDLRQYVHYSATGKDTSWHWTWSCDGWVSLSGGHALYDHGYPVVTRSVSNSGTSGDQNIRYYGCVGTYWYGQAYGTFSSPGHISASFEGSGPSHLINCP